MADALLKWAQSNTHSKTIRDYKHDILQYCENLAVLPSSESSMQQEISLLRSSVLNSLLDVSMRLNWSCSTFALSVHLFDNYTSKNKIDLSKCVLLGFCCLWISFKYNENKPKAKLLGALLKRAGYPPESRNDFIQLEFSILESINWDLSFISPDTLVDLILDSNDPNYNEKRLGAIFLCEISLFNTDIMHNYSCNEIANCAISLTNVAWKNLRHKHIKNHKYYQLDNIILNSILNLEPAIKFKYLNSPTYSNCSIISNLINLAVQFLREEQINQNQSSAYWNPNSNCDSQIKNNQLYLVSPMASPVTPSLRIQTHNSQSSTLTPQYLLPTPGTTPTSANYGITSNTRGSSSLYSTPAQQRTIPLSSRSSNSLSDHFYSPIVKRPLTKPLDSNFNHHNRHIPILTRSKAKRYMQIDGYLNEIPNVLLSQQLDHHSTTHSFKRRKM